VNKEKERNYFFSLIVMVALTFIVVEALVAIEFCTLGATDKLIVIVLALVALCTIIEIYHLYRIEKRLDDEFKKAVEGLYGGEKRT
jgi:hypothetical protein